MFVDFDKINEDSRLWVYQSDKKLEANTQQNIKDSFKEFLDTWQAHGNELFASIEIVDDYFLLIALDETRGGASGCSIDSQVNFVKKVGDRFELNFFDRTKVAFQNNDTLVLFPLSKLKESVLKGEIKSETLLYNTLISKKGELFDKWLLPVKESWVKRYF